MNVRAIVVALIVISSLNCSGKGNTPSDSAIHHQCDMAAARQAFLTGSNADSAGDYPNALKQLMASAERYGACAAVASGGNRLQTEYDQGSALWLESIVLSELKDSRTDPVALSAENLFQTVAADPAAEIANRWYEKPDKTTLRQDAQRNVNALKNQIRLNDLINTLPVPPARGPVDHTSQSQGGLQTFDNEDDAQAHCPDDTVVWLNLSSGIYHMKGERWYGATENGAYVCQQEANAAGDRETENGQ